MHRIKRALAWSTRTRKRKVVSVVAALALIGAGTAVAQWIIFTGGSGQAAGKFSTATPSDALSFTPDASLVVNTLEPGGNGDLGLRVTNNAGVSETITGVTATFTSTPASCASHLSINSAPFLITIPTGSSQPWQVINAVHADSSLPGACSSGTFTANLTVTTNP